MQRWEYMYCSLVHTRTRGEKIGGEGVGRIQQNEAILNALGAEGWEVVGFSAPGANYREVILKRSRD